MHVLVCLLMFCQNCCVNIFALYFLMALLVSCKSAYSVILQRVCSDCYVSRVCQLFKIFGAPGHIIGQGVPFPQETGSVWTFWCKIWLGVGWSWEVAVPLPRKFFLSGNDIFWCLLTTLPDRAWLPLGQLLGVHAPVSPSKLKCLHLVISPMFCCYRV